MTTGRPAEDSRRAIIPRLVQGACAAVAAPLFVNYLGAGPYGLLALVACLGSAVAMLDLSLPSLLARRTAVHGGRPEPLTRQSLRIQLAVAGILTTISWVAAWALAPRVNSTLSPIEVIVTLGTAGTAAAIRFPLAALHGIIQGSLGQSRLGWITMSQTAAATVGGALCLQIWNHPAALGLWQLAVGLHGLIFGWRLVSIMPAHSAEPLLPHRPYLVNSTVAAGLACLSLTADRLIAIAVVPLPVFTAYALAGAMAAVGVILIPSQTGAWLPELARQHGSPLHLGKQLRLLLLTIGSTATPVLAVMATLVPTALPAILGDPVLVAHIAALLPPLALAAWFGGLAIGCYQVQLAKGISTIVLGTNLALALLGAPLLWLLGTAYGGAGIAWGTAMLSFVNLVIHGGAAFRLVDRSLLAGLTFPLFLPAGVLVLVGIALQQVIIHGCPWPSFAAIALGILVGLAGVIVLRKLAAEGDHEH